MGSRCGSRWRYVGRFDVCLYGAPIPVRVKFGLTLILMSAGKMDFLSVGEAEGRTDSHRRTSSARASARNGASLGVGHDRVAAISVGARRLRLIVGNGGTLHVADSGYSRQPVHDG